MTPSRRVLVIQCCRPARAIEAADIIRRTDPAAIVTVLCRPAAAAEIEAAGLPVIRYAPARFGPLRIPRRLRSQLRQMAFDVLAIPYMVPDDAAHANVHRLGLVLGASATLVLREGDRIQCLTPAGLRHLAARSTLARAARLLDVPVLLGTLIIGRVIPRRSPRVGRQRVLHVISGLGAGGAQRQLAQLIARTPADRYRVDVLVLARYEGDFSRMQFPGVDIRYVDTWPNIARSIREVFALCRRERYDIVHTWLFAANLLGVAAARLAGTPRVIASVRNMSLWKRHWFHRPWFRPADALASRAADIVTVNAAKLVNDHARWAWYPAHRIRVVPNGIDTHAVKIARAGARAFLVNELSLTPSACIVGTVGRLSAEKDHATFLRIVARLRTAVPTVQAVLVGGGDAEPGLRLLARDLGIAHLVRFARERPDATRLMGGFDLLVLTSRCEGLPNVLLEAACLGVPAISTDVGGCGELLDDPELLFASADDEQGCARARTLLERPALARLRAERVRQRAMVHFSAERMAAAWLELYQPGRSETTPEPMMAAETRVA